MVIGLLYFCNMEGFAECVYGTAFSRSNEAKKHCVGELNDEPIDETQTGCSERKHCTQLKYPTQPTKDITKNTEIHRKLSFP